MNKNTNGIQLIVYAAENFCHLLFEKLQGIRYISTPELPRELSIMYAVI